jgi:hypothetical protein
MTTLLILVLTLAFWGQDATRNDSPPGVTIVKYKWQRIGVGPTVDATFKAENDSPTGGSSDTNVPPQASGLRDRESPFFLYSLELRNDTSKSIRAILWDYLIIDSKANEELGRHEFVSFEKVGRGGARTITVRSRLLPSRLVTVEDSPPTTTLTVVERVVLKCVVFDDGSVWQQTPTLGQSCEALRKRTKN